MKAALGALTAALLFTLQAYTAQAQSDYAWSSDEVEALEGILYEFMQCTDKLDDLTPCNKFVAQAVERLYCIDDFIAEDRDPPYFVGKPDC